MTQMGNLPVPEIPETTSMTDIMVRTSPQFLNEAKNPQKQTNLWSEVNDQTLMSKLDTQDKKRYRKFGEKLPKLAILVPEESSGMQKMTKKL